MMSDHKKKHHEVKKIVKVEKSSSKRESGNGNGNGNKNENISIPINANINKPEFSPVYNLYLGAEGLAESYVGSAFRAISVANLPVPANTAVKVLYSSEQFDLANEYDIVTSTFVPKQNGIYLISGTISFAPVIIANNNVAVEIRVNGNPAVAIDNDFFGPLLNTNAVTVSSVLQLQAGDQVEIFASSSVDGAIVPNTPGANSTHFEAARFPSPTT